MILKKLKIHNIASIEDAEIDFTKGPLADADVFLISGKTGSGKSTILDAICLALYSNTPRLKNLEQSAKLEHDHDLSTKDPRNLMRRGTGECSVTLTFTGNDGVDYEAVWSAARSRRIANGNPQGKQWSLHNSATGVVLTKESETKPAIEAATGLSFEQFCRTTMLAQGDFLRFLNSKNEDKSEILEKITGTDVYSRIGRKIYDLYAIHKQEYQTADERTKSVKLLSDTQIAEKNERIAAIERDDSELKKRLDGWRVCVRWLEDEETLKKQIHDGEEELAQISKAIGGDEFRLSKLQVEQWNATIEARQQLRNLGDVQNDADKLKDELNRQRDRYCKALGGLNHEMEKLETSKSERSQLDDFIKSEMPRATVYEQERLIVGRLNDIETTRRQTDAIAAKIKTLENKLVDLKRNQQEKYSKRDELKRLQDQKERELVVESQRLAESGLSRLREKRDALVSALNDVKLAETQIKTLRSEFDRTEKEKGQIATISARIERCRTEYLKLCAQLQQAAEQEKSAQETYNKLSGSVDEWAKVARANLTPGDLCPVCRQMVTDVPHIEEELQALVDAARSDLSEKETQRKKLESECNLQKASVEADGRLLEATRNQYSESVRNLHDVQKRFAEAYVKATNGDLSTLLSHDAKELDDTVDYESILADARRQREAQMHETDERLRMAEQIEQGVKKRQSDLTKHSENMMKSEREAVEADVAVAKCKGDIDGEKQLSVQHNERVKTLNAEISELLGNLVWNSDWRVNPAGFVAELHNACKKYSESREALSKLDSLIELMEQDTRRISDDLARVLENIPSWKSVTVGEKYEFDSLSRAVRDLLGKVSALVGQQKGFDERIAYSNEWLVAYYASTGITAERLAELDAIGQEEIEINRRNNEEMERKYATATSLLKSQREIYDAHLKSRPMILGELDNRNIMPTEGRQDVNYETPRDLLQHWISKYENLQKEMAQELGALRQELSIDAQDRARLKQYLEDAENKKLLYERWASLNSLLGDSTGKNFRIIAQSYILDNIIHSANHYMRSLGDRYELRVMPGSFVIEVVDAYQGYVARPSSTLSGGEGFLVSLALALALSDVGNHLSSNILFIDEGFGTLSGEPLQNAVNTLKSLHTKTGRHVGIISHIEELRERMPVQIQINQPGHASSSTVRVVG